MACDCVLYIRKEQNTYTQKHTHDTILFEYMTDFHINENENKPMDDSKILCFLIKSNNNINTKTNVNKQTTMGSTRTFYCFDFFFSTK